MSHWVRAMRFFVPGVCLLAANAHAAVSDQDVGVALTEALAALERDVREVLPWRSALHDSDASGHVRWSMAEVRLRDACRAHEQCQRVMVAAVEAIGEKLSGHLAEIKALAPQGRAGGRQYMEHLQQVPVLLYTADRICEAAWQAGKSLYLCGTGHAWAMSAARYWFDLGNESLGLAIQGEAQTADQSTRDWMRTAEMTDAMRADWQAQLDTAEKAGIPVLDSLEARDEPGVALWAALGSLGEKFVSGKTPTVELAIPAAEFARVAVGLTGAQAGRDWMAALQVLAQDLDAGQASACGWQAAILRVGIVAQPQSLDMPARQLALQQAGCGIAQVTSEYAQAMLIAGQPAEAGAALEFALGDCRRHGHCAPWWHARLKAMDQVANGSRRDRRRLAETWLGDKAPGALAPDKDGLPQLRQGGFPLLAFERRFLWALAEALDADGAAETAAAVYARLDQSVDMKRNATSFRGIATVQQDLARYDVIKRIRARNDVRAGKVLVPDAVEILRGQRLRNRLWLARMRQELAGVVDEAAREQRDAQLAQLAEAGNLFAAQDIDDVPLASASQRPLMEVYFPVVRDLLADAGSVVEEAYLEALARRAIEQEGGRVWGSALTHRDERRSAMSVFGDGALQAADFPLAKDEAYLTFLQVPDGYVVVSVPVLHRRVPWPGITSRFVPFGPAQQRALDIYRRLLQQAARPTRGIERRVEPPSAAGPTLDGQPVWRTPDGEFVVARAKPAGASRVTSAAEIGDLLQALLLEPFLADYQDAVRLYISPDGALSLLPFEALTRRGVSVLEAVDIAYVQSMDIFRELKARGVAAETQAGLFSLADPVYVPGVDPLEWQPLPGTRAESERLAQLFPGATRWLGAQADRDRLVETASAGKLQDFRFLHFATHGHVDDRRSALVLSNAKGAASSYLTDEQVAGLRLGSDLVLLSACDTGVGRDEKGEGVVGLPYAFFMAGNRNTLMSLWPVDDAGTAAFIPEFMRRVRAGTDVVTALSDTRRAFARGEHGEALRDPRIWAAFVLYGAAAPLVP